MITITAEAQEKLLELWAEKKNINRGLLVAITGRGAKDFEYMVRFIGQDEELDDKALMELDDLNIFTDEESFDNLKGSTLDFVPFSGFRIDNPNPLWSWSDPLSQAVQDVLTKTINPQIAAHGGSVQLLEVKDNVAYIEMGGGCVGCGLVDVTLKQGVAVAIRTAVPEIESIVDTTDHAKGTNPYYQDSGDGGPQNQPAKGGGPQNQPAKGGGPQNQPAKGGGPQNPPAKGGQAAPSSPFE